MVSEEDQKELSKQEHWDSRYSGTRQDGLGEHEWLGDFKTLRPFLVKHIPKPAGEMYPRILHLGCGTSEITKELFDLGYASQDNVDFSPIAIEAMRKRYGDLEGLRWMVMDVRKMDFEAGTFDIMFDKSTLDVMLWGSLWDPDDQVKANVGAYVDEVARCLKPGGKWLCVTFRQPHFIRPLLRRDDVWNLAVEILGGQDGSFEYFGWVLEKL